MKVGTAPFGAFPLLHARFPNLRPYKGAFHEGNDPLRTGGAGRVPRRRREAILGVCNPPSAPWGGHLRGGG